MITMTQPHIIDVTPKRPFNKPRWIPWIVFAILFVLSPVFTLVVTIFMLLWSCAVYGGGVFKSMFGGDDS